METVRIDKENLNYISISKDDSGFTLEFIKNKKRLILNTAEVLLFSHDEDNKLTISCRYLHKSDIEIVNKYFKDKWMLSTGILGDRDFIRINILN